MSAPLEDPVLARTRAFYEWEIRGRGWHLFPYPVDLEPVFRPFAHYTPPPRPIDDARRPTFLSRLFERERDAPAPAELPTDAGEEEPPAPAEPTDFRNLLVILSEEAAVPRQAILDWLTTLSAVSAPLSLELLGGESRVELRLAVPEADLSHVTGQLKALLPTAAVVEAQETLVEWWRGCRSESIGAADFGLSSEFMVPLDSSAGGDEPLLPLVASLADLRRSEAGIFQVLFRPARHPWPESILRSVLTPRGEPFFADAPEVTKLAKEKVSSPLFAASVRIAARAKAPERVEEILRRLAAGVTRFGSPGSNELIALDPGDPTLLAEDILLRRTSRSGMLLSADELSSLTKLPGKSVRVPELLRQVERTKEPPPEVLGGGCFVGENRHQGEVREVRLQVEARTKHLHVIGSSGTGKSTLLVRMILDDIAAGHGVGVLDPHGDLVDEVAGRLPDERLDETVLFDPSDREHVVGWNILGAASEVERDLLASDLVGVFRRLSTSWGDQMTSVLSNAILVFLEAEGGGTLSDLRRFLVEEKFRRAVLARVADPHVRSFWQTEFPLLVGRRPQAPILTRLDTFLRSRLVRRLVTARKPRLDFRQVVDGGLVFLGKLAQGEIGEENAALLGSLLVSKFHQVSIARQRTAVEKRRPFFLYIDEFHHLATPSMAALFSGARKYRLGLTVAHQDLYQLHREVPEVERSILANAYSRIVFRLGDEDARTLERGFSAFDARELTRLGVGEAIARVGGSEDDFNLRTLPLEPQDRNEAERRRERLRALSGSRWGAEAEEEPEEGGEEPQTEHVAEESGPAPATARAAEKEAPEEPPEKTEARLPKEELDYLELVATEPFLSIRERNEKLDLSAWKGQRMKKKLLERGFIREVPVNPGGRGERFVLLELTPEGRNLLSTYGVKATIGHGRGGVAHQWWTRRIAEWLREEGIETAVEDDSRGARVDLSFKTRGQTVAVEVEMTDGNALENLRKDLAAGYEAVVLLFDRPRDLERVRERLPQDLPEERFRLAELAPFREALAPHLGASAPLRPPKQDQEPRKRRQRKRPVEKAPEPEAPVLPTPEALSTPAAADYLGLSPATLETLRSRGGGPPFVKLGRRVVYRRRDLDRWLEDRRRRSTSDPGPRG